MPRDPIERTPLPPASTLQKLFTGLIMATAYVLGTWLLVRIIVLTSWKQLIQAIDVVPGLLLEGGVFGFLIYLIRQNRAERAAKEVSRVIREKMAAKAQEDTA